MNVAIISSECAPFAQTGGLADVIGTLPHYLSELGISVKVFIPKYDSIDEKKYRLTFDSNLGVTKVRVGGVARDVYLHSTKIPRSAVDIYFIDCREFFYRGKLYTEDWDEDERFILFQKAVIEILQRLQWTPDVIHCNDWQTGLIPILLKENYHWDRMFDATSTIMSIHNIGYQGRFSADAFAKAEIDASHHFAYNALTMENGVSFLKGGILSADLISTVSETYAKEILTPHYGAGLEQSIKIREADLYGILNGIDINEWNPETDRYLPHHYSFETIANKKKLKQFLLSKTTLQFDETKPVIGIISRLVKQKGFDLIANAIHDLLELNAQWVILGSGEWQYESLFQAMSMMLPHTCWCHIGFNNELAHCIEAGADMFLMPSHYEPCGLNQMYSLRYGTVPIVRKTGGLADTVRDWHEYAALGKYSGNGFSFVDATESALLHSVQRAIDSFRLPEEWRNIQRNGMNGDFSWNTSARKYKKLYERSIIRKH